jgi:hypothetical protein
VHYGHEDKAEASQKLKEVADAFQDCQAVQARVVERIGLEILGVALDFRGLVTALLGEYKTWALKMLAMERIMQGKAFDDDAPTHYENRLTADLGEHLGLNADDIRRAELDVHAKSRFAKLSAEEATAAAARCRELFDLKAFLQALVSQLNSYKSSSDASSLPRLFLKWTCEHMNEKHVVLDEETISKVDIDCTLARAVLEMLYLNRLTGLAGDEYRGIKFSDIFHRSSKSIVKETVQSESDLTSDALQVVHQKEETVQPEVHLTMNVLQVVGDDEGWLVVGTDAQNCENHEATRWVRFQLPGYSEFALASLVGLYKSVALKLLVGRQVKTHRDESLMVYESQLAGYLGKRLGLNADDVRTTVLAAQSMFKRLAPSKAIAAAAQCRECVNLKDFSQLAPKLNRFNVASVSNAGCQLSLGRLRGHKDGGSRKRRAQKQEMGNIVKRLRKSAESHELNTKEVEANTL